MDLVTTCIDPALGDLKLLHNNVDSSISDSSKKGYSRPAHILPYWVPILMHRLRNLGLFILCVRKLGYDMHLTHDNNNKKKGTLGSLLVRIEETVCRNAQEIKPYCLSSVPELDLVVPRKITQFTKDIDSFKKEVEEWYVCLTDFLQQSVSPTADNVMDITNYVLENLEDLLSYFGGQTGASVMESLGEMMKFLKNFVRFATLRRVESQQLLDLLNPIEGVVVNAAQLSFKYQYGGHTKGINRSETKVLAAEDQTY